MLLNRPFAMHARRRDRTARTFLPWPSWSSAWARPLLLLAAAAGASLAAWAAATEKRSRSDRSRAAAVRRGGHGAMSGLLLLVVSWDRVGWLCFGWILGFMEAGEVFGLELRGVGSNECRGGQEAMAGTHYKCTRMLSFIFR